MIKFYWTRFLPRYITALLYMLQNSEYHIGEYLHWLHRTADFRRVMYRRQLDPTLKVRLLRLLMIFTALVIIDLVVVGLYLGFSMADGLWIIASGALILASPFILAYGIIGPLFIGWLLVQKPQERAIIQRARRILAEHEGFRIGIAGSYGKTTIKEILAVVLSEGKKVAATPGNMNTPIGMSRFANKLQGDEDILIFEYGEGKVGDVRQLARLSKPNMGVITGVNEAHLSSFKTLDNTANTIFELEDFVDADKLYVNGESRLAKKRAGKHPLFDRKQAGGWRISRAATSVLGTEFVMRKADERINVSTSLVGLHTVGVTAVAAAIARELGLTVEQIEQGLRNVRPFEHRMEPKPLHGAWIIDDTYNGNSEGIEAGLAFLKTADARRRVYVTPGLVEQGNQTQKVHEKIGELAAGSADVVVLMNNSTTEHIVAGLKRKKFNGRLTIIDDPLDFYTNLDLYTAHGDLVLMQNDWTDNYR